MSDRTVPPADSSDRAEKAEKKERLRRRLKAGAFTVLLALGFATSTASPADAAPLPRGVLEQRIEQVRAVLGKPDADPARADQPAQPWGNGWINWHNGWHNWHNAWNNWSDWNNWSNAWNNWSDWSNWHNAWGNV